MKKTLNTDSWLPQACPPPCTHSPACRCTHINTHMYTYLHKKNVEGPASPEMHGRVSQKLLNKIKFNQEGRWTGRRNAG